MCRAVRLEQFKLGRIVQVPFIACTDLVLSVRRRHITANSTSNASEIMAYGETNLIHMKLDHSRGVSGVRSLARASFGFAVAVQFSLEVLSVCEASKVDGTALDLADVLEFEG
jgi:hypothetical protein